MKRKRGRRGSTCELGDRQATSLPIGHSLSHVNDDIHALSIFPFQQVVLCAARDALEPLILPVCVSMHVCLAFYGSAERELSW